MNRTARELATALAALVILSGSPSFAQDWVLGGMATEATQFYDQDSIRSSGDRRSAWVLTVYRSTGNVGDGNPFDYVLTRVETDCFAATSRFTAMRSFVFGSEEPNFSFNEPGEWAPLEPGTMVETTSDLICEGTRQDSLGASNLHDIALRARRVMAAE